MNKDFLRELREKHNYTQNDIANSLGMATPSYFKIEKGDNNLHPRHWSKICGLLECSEDELRQFCAYISELKKQKKHIDQSNDDLQDRIGWVKKLKQQVYVEIVNSLEDGRLDPFDIAKGEDIEDFRDRAIIAVSRLDIPADAKGKVVSLLSDMDLFPPDPPEKNNNKEGENGK